MVTPITGESCIKPLQFAFETTPGVFPTNPAMQWLGYSANWSVGHEFDQVALPQLEAEDPQYLIATRQLARVRLDWIMHNPSLVAQGLNPNVPGNQSGTPDQSMSFVWSAPLGGSGETFYQVLGCLMESVTITARMGEGIRASASLVGSSTPLPTTISPVGLGTYAVDPQILPFLLEFDLIQIGGITVDVQEISLSGRRNTYQLYPLESTTFQWQKMTRREITGRIVILWENTTTEGQLLNASQQDIVWTLRKNVNSITLRQCQFSRLESIRVAEDDLKETYAFTAQSAAVA